MIGPAKHAKHAIAEHPQTTKTTKLKAKKQANDQKLLAEIDGVAGRDI